MNESCKSTNNGLAQKFDYESMALIVSDYIQFLKNNNSPAYAVSNVRNVLIKQLAHVSIDDLTATFVLNNLSKIDVNEIRKPFLRFILYAIQTRTIKDKNLIRINDFRYRIEIGTINKGVIASILQDSYYDVFKRSDVYRNINENKYAYSL